MQLNEKQKRFCEEYIIDLNGTQAAIRAGYSKKTANTFASQLLAKSNVQAYVFKLRSNQTKRLEITADKVLQEYAKIGFADLKDFLSFDETGVIFKNSKDVDGTIINEVSSEKTTTITGSGDNQQEVERVKFKMKLHSKSDALEKLARHLNLLNEMGAGLSEDETNKLRNLIKSEPIENHI